MNVEARVSRLTVVADIEDGAVTADILAADAETTNVIPNSIAHGIGYCQYSADLTICLPGVSLPTIGTYHG